MGLFYPFQSNNPLSTRPCSSIVARSLHTRWVAPRISTVFHHDISYSFTNDEEVAEIGSSVSVLAFLILLNSVQLVLTGVAVGAGWQGVVAIIIIGCCYVIGIPLGVLLAYVVHLSIRLFFSNVGSMGLTQNQEFLL
eukprot:XP_019077323.1 PREDICTED: protein DETOXIFICATION 20 isoform X2 [Vitis vinifera]